MSRPRNNLDELQRRQALLTASSPTKPAHATPRAGGSKSKFKPAKSIPESTAPPPGTIKKLGSWSTPGFNKTKPTPIPLNSPSLADNSVLPYIDVSSTDTISVDVSITNVPKKRASPGHSEDVLSHNKRPRTVPDKENEFHIARKGKARAPEFTLAPPITKKTTSLPILTVPNPYAHPYRHNVSLKDAFNALAHDAALSEKSETELKGVCNTALELSEACNKLIGAARGCPDTPHDVELLTILSDFLEERADASRAELKSIQRGERAGNSRTSSVEANFPTGSSTTLHSDQSNLDPLLPFDVAQTSTPIRNKFDIEPLPEIADNDEDYWNLFPSDPPDIDLTRDEPILTPATPPATHPQPLPQIDFENSFPPPDPAESADSKAKPYYNELLDTLKRVFKLSSFRPKQLDAICAAMDGRDVFVLFPTGSGKSLTFQLPAVCQKGVTVVISPLLSLMRDQVQALQKIGVKCALITGDMRDAERSDVYAQLWGRDKPSLLYITPELLQQGKRMQSTLERLHEQDQLMRFVIDEAHCISDWGRRFRDSYTNLTELRKTYPRVPISALTATANAEVEHDIISRLDIGNCVRLKLSFNRTNLDYEVRPKKGHKACVDEVAALVQQRFPTHTGIIYCHSRAKCEEVAKELRDHYRLKARHFHAGLADYDKQRVQREWSEGKILIIVATVAFGMGIDKADVRYVIHFTLPATLANYYQETGRAGRDGKLAHCILFYSYGDVTPRLEMIRQEDKPPEEKLWMEADFWNVVRYCHNDVRCRRQQVLDFFGETFDPSLCHDLCNNCRDKTPVMRENHTEDAVKAVALFQNLSRDRTPVTKSQLVSALRGSKQKVMVEKGFVNADGYGSCKHLTLQLAERLVDEMLFQGVLTTVQQKTYQDYASSYLKLASKVSDLKKGKMQIQFEYRSTGRAPSSKVPRTTKSRNKGGAQDTHDINFAVYDFPESPIAGPSNAAPSRSRKAKTVAQEKPVRLLSLFVDDPEDDPDWQDDDIEEVSSPLPRRVSSTVQAQLESDIEEDDVPSSRRPQPKVTLITQKDLVDCQPTGDQTIEECCYKDLSDLRNKIREEDQDLARILSDQALFGLGAVLPDNPQALREELDNAGIDIALLGKWAENILQICKNYNVTRTQG